MKTYRCVGAKFTAVGFVLTMMIPNVALVLTGDCAPAAVASALALPAGFYMLWSVAARRSGVMILAALPLMALGAFQTVLIYMFGSEVISTDMFTNLFTTNNAEASEVLVNITSAVIVALLVYMPIIVAAISELLARSALPSRFRRTMFLAAVFFSAAGIVAADHARRCDERRTLLCDVFPFNAVCNLGASLYELYNVRHYNPDGFTFAARREYHSAVPQREIYMFIIGEAARACNWQLYGYSRQTTPRLSSRGDIVAFDNVLSLSNTTHKCVPMLLSPTDPERYDELYTRKGLPALFREAGFRTCVVSNQAPQGAMIDRLAADADTVIYMGEPRYDMAMLEPVRLITEHTPPQTPLLFILHCYGSHYSYRRRYPREEAVFLPDDYTSIRLAERNKFVNAYDNTVRYTDHFLARVIEWIDSLDCCSAVFYCPDHGEDLMDDTRGRLLHASPTVTYYQLHIPCIAWFSPRYCASRQHKAAAARDNVHAPATNISAFHTVADMASIVSPHVDVRRSLVSPRFDTLAPRRYIGDRNRPAAFDRSIGLTNEDMEQFRRRGIRLD